MSARGNRRAEILHVSRHVSGVEENDWVAGSTGKCHNYIIYTAGFMVIHLLRKVYRIRTSRT